MTIPYEAPDFNKTAFNCPWCNAFASVTNATVTLERPGVNRHHTDFRSTKCERCHAVCFWLPSPTAGKGVEFRMVFPSRSAAPLPHQDLPENARADYDEARSVLGQSPRAATALLRLCIERLVDELEAKGKNLDAKIADLVTKGLSPKVQKALDVVRVTGNNAVHPGAMDSVDSPETAQSLFRLVNMIVEQVVTQPRDVEALFEGLPESAKAAIARRDGTEEKK